MKTVPFVTSYGLACALVLLPTTGQAEPEGTAFSYQGQLTQGGVPVSDSYDLEFTLWSDPNNSDPNSQVGPVLSFDGVGGNPAPLQVTGGLFDVVLDFGSDVFTGETRWLEIGVRPAGSADAYTILSPRQWIAPTAYALYALNAPSATGTPWEGSGEDIFYTGGNVGIGTSSPQGVLHVAGPTILHGALSIDTSASGSPLLDQSQTATEFTNMLDSDWQSFTAGSDGILTQIDILSNAGWLWGNVTLRVYTGEGITGTLLYEQQYPIGEAPGDGIITLTIPPESGPAVTVGSVFSFQLEDPQGLVVLKSGDPYPDGQCSICFGCDLWFKTYVQVGYNPGGEVVVSADGRLGVGTSSPQALLEVQPVVTGDGVLLPGLRTYYNAESPNILGGHIANTIDSGSVGATLGGGGNSVHPNSIVGTYGTVGGGEGNYTTGDYATVCGGYGNAAAQQGATVVGGFLGTADSTMSTVCGGYRNHAAGQYSFAAGHRAKANHLGTFVWADATDVDFTSTADKQFLIRASGGVGIGTDSPSNQLSVGGDMDVRGRASIGYGNTFSGVYSFVVGAYCETAGDYASVGGGNTNFANGYCATVGGGGGNTAGSFSATVGGGYGNSAIGEYAVVTGGYSNTASGKYSAVLGGKWNVSAGMCSVAAGEFAKADNDGTFVFADRSEKIFRSIADNEFAVRCTGGARLVSAIDIMSGNPTAGVSLPAGGSGWGVISDRAAKTDFEDVDERELLARLAAVPVQTWSYKTQDRSIRHVGPVAQDFHAAFGVGEDDKHINTIDADGVALAAIQGLYQIVQAKDAEIADLKERLAKMEAAVTALTTAGTGGGQ